MLNLTNFVSKTSSNMVRPMLKIYLVNCMLFRGECCKSEPCEQRELLDQVN